MNIFQRSLLEFLDLAKNCQFLHWKLNLCPIWIYGWTLTKIRERYFKIHAKYNKLPLEKLNGISIGYKCSSISMTGKARPIETQ